MSSPIAFSITWPQLERLRELPSDVLSGADEALIAKGLIEPSWGLLARPGRVELTPSGKALRLALAGLAQS